MKRAIKVHGSMTALVTPFRDGSVDYERMKLLVERQIEGGTDWLVPCGTTGESPTLTHDEHARLVEIVLTHAAGRLPVMVGTGTNCTAETIRRTREAHRAGADAALVVAPYYNRPTDEGLFRHFAAVAESADLPIVLYNVPARCGIAINNDVVVRLADRCPNVVAIKHATGSIDGVTDLIGRSRLAVLSGDDAITWPMMALGAVGVISVIGNLRPELMKSLVTAASRGAISDAKSYHSQVHELAATLGRFGPNPIPIKTAMALEGLLDEEFRLPLCPLEPATRTALERELRRIVAREPVCA